MVRTAKLLKFHPIRSLGSSPTLPVHFGQQLEPVGWCSFIDRCEHQQRNQDRSHDATSIDSGPYTVGTAIGRPSLGPMVRTEMPSANLRLLRPLAPTNNFHLLPEQHSQQPALGVFLEPCNGDRGR